MTEQEAKKLVLEDLNLIKDEEYPLRWVGDVIKEDEESFIIVGSTYKNGENPRLDAIPYIVNKKTGEVKPDIVLE